MDNQHLLLEIQRLLVEVNREVTRIGYLAGIIVALEVAVILVCLLQTLMIDRMRGIVLGNREAIKQLMELWDVANNLRDRESREIADASLHAARLAEQTAKRLQTTWHAAHLETKVSPASSDPNIPAFTPEQREKAEERHKRGNGGSDAG